MHCNRSIAQHGFRARGGNHDMAAAIAERILQVPELAVFFFRQYFEVGQRGVQYRVPVDQALAAIDQAFVVQRFEYFQYGGRAGVVHGEDFTRPVGRIAETAHLPGDGIAGIGFPLPDLVDERVAPEIVA